MFGRVAAWSGAACLAALLAFVPARSAIERELRSPADIVADAVAAARGPVEPWANPAERDSTPHDERTAPTANTSPPIAPVDPPSALPPGAIPFGLAATRMTGGDVAGKWQAVTAQIAADNEMLAHCRVAGMACPPAARKFLAIVQQGRAASGRARIGIINRAINLAIEPMSDLAQWGVADRWSPPLETFASGRGDCEDYAIAKYVALTAAGLASADVKLVIVHNTAADEDHAVVAVRLDGDWIMLDNRWLTLVTDSAMRRAVPLFVLDDDGVRKFAPPAVAGTRPEPAPASL